MRLEVIVAVFCALLAVMLGGAIFLSTCKAEESRPHYESVPLIF
jgi:hypothetical protein